MAKVGRMERSEVGKAAVREGGKGMSILTGAVAIA